MNQEEQKRKSGDIADAGKAPGRPINAPDRIPGQNIDKEHAQRKEKDGEVGEDGRGRLTRRGK